MAVHWRGRQRLFRLGMVGAVVFVVASGAGTAAPTTTLPRRSAGRVFVAGDSITFSAIWDQGPGEGAPADVDWAAWLGWTAADVQTQLDAAVSQGSVDTLVVALGTNDSALEGGGDGWTQADVERFRHLIGTVGPNACVVVVLPGHGPGIDSRHAAAMDQARAALTELADQRQGITGDAPTVVVDWQRVVDAHPELVAADGIHLARDAATGKVSARAAVARTTLYWRGVDACTG